MPPAGSESTGLPELLQKLVAAKQLSAPDAQSLARIVRSGSSALVRSEEDVLRWLAKEYDVPFNSLEGVEPDKQVLALFPARILLKEELLPLRRNDAGVIEVATSRLFATQGFDTLKTMTGLRLKPLLAPSEAITREMKRHLGVGAEGDAHVLPALFGGHEIACHARLRRGL